MSKAGINFRQGRSGFTLVELLVVVAIIALLVSILLPTLGRAKEQTRIVVCLTNLKGLSSAASCYTAENDDWYPAACACGGLDYGMSRGAVSGSEYAWDTILLPYYQVIDMIHCPTDKFDRTPYYNGTPSGWSNSGPGVPSDRRYPRSYAINFEVTAMGPSADGEATGYWGSIPPFPWPVDVGKAADVTDPGDTVFLADVWEWYSWYNSGDVWPGIHGGYQTSWTRGENLNPGRGPTNEHGRGGSANYIFCDGHATLLPEDYPSLTDEGNNYYWFREK